MILQKLVDFAGRIPDLPPPMYSPLAFNWQIELDDYGNYKGITPLSDGNKKNRGLYLLTPNVKRSSGIKPLLLADNTEYVFGINKPKTTNEKITPDPVGSKKFNEFLSLAEQCSSKTNENTVSAVVKFLKNFKSNPNLLSSDIKSGDMILFRVGNIRPTDLQSVRNFWADYNNTDATDKKQCLVCGEKKSVDRVSPVAIKGLSGIGGQSTGMAIVTANKDAFLSYGAEQSLIAPTCRICGEAYANSLNHMISNDKYHIFVGPTVFVFWTSEDSDFDIVNFFKQPDENDVKTLIESYKNGKPGYLQDSESFYTLSISASGSRVVVRDWLNTTIPHVKEKLARWFKLQKIIDNKGNEAGYYGVYALAASLYKEPNKQMIPEVPRILIRCALNGGMLPDYLLAQSISRNSSERQVTRNRAALIKAILLSQMDSIKEDYMESLDVKCESPGYLCGRLLAELEAAQKAAINPKATLVDRYYGSASSAPASVFGNLMSGLQSHMAKLRRDKPRIYVMIDKNIQEITQKLCEFPKVLVLKDQAMFALGYYHQKAVRWNKTDKNDSIAEGDENELK